MDSLKKSLDSMGNPNTSSSKPSADTQNQDVKKTTIAPTRKTADGRIVETNPPVDPCASKPGEPTTPGRARGVNCLPNTSDRASVADWTVQMKKDMEKSKQDIDKSKPKSAVERDNFKQLVSQADSAYRCGSGGSYVISKNEVKMFNPFNADITNTFSNVRFDGNLIYFTAKQQNAVGDVKYVLDTKESKLILTFKQVTDFKNPSNKSDMVMDETCKKLK
jgi:hypothetical protein